MTSRYYECSNCGVVEPCRHDIVDNVVRAMATGALRDGAPRAIECLSELAKPEDLAYAIRVASEAHAHADGKARADLATWHDRAVARRNELMDRSERGVELHVIGTPLKQWEPERELRMTPFNNRDTEAPAHNATPELERLRHGGAVLEPEPPMAPRFPIESSPRAYAKWAAGPLTIEEAIIKTANAVRDWKPRAPAEVATLNTPHGTIRLVADPSVSPTATPTVHAVWQTPFDNPNETFDSGAAQRIEARRVRPPEGFCTTVGGDVVQFTGIAPGDYIFRCGTNMPDSVAAEPQTKPAGLNMDCAYDAMGQLTDQVATPPTYAMGPDLPPVARTRRALADEERRIAADENDRVQSERADGNVDAMRTENKRLRANLMSLRRTTTGISELMSDMQTNAANSRDRAANLERENARLSETAKRAQQSNIEFTMRNGELQELNARLLADIGVAKYHHELFNELYQHGTDACAVVFGRSIVAAGDGEPELPALFDALAAEISRLRSIIAERPPTLARGATVACQNDEEEP